MKNIGRAANRKGKGFERKVASFLSENLLPCERVLTEVRDGGDWDIVSKEKTASGEPKVRVQCKRRKRIAFLNEIEESLSKIEDGFGRVSLWALKQDRGSLYALLSLNKFVEILQYAKIAGLFEHQEKQVITDAEPSRPSDIRVSQERTNGTASDSKSAGG